MTRVHIALILSIVLLYWGCELPFDTKPTDKENLFTITHDYEGQPIVIPTPITIYWSDITIEQFKEFLIERTTVSDTGLNWMIVAHVGDSLATSYTDTLDDDATFQYRVRIVNQNNQFRHTLSEPVTVPRVNSVVVPDDYQSLQEAYDSKFVDSGDTVLVQPGEYKGNFMFLDKDVYIKGVQGPTLTKLVAQHVGVTEIPTRPLHTFYSPSVVEINRGILVGFTIAGGVALYGGGIKVLGNAQVINCIIKNNKAIAHPDPWFDSYPMGYGGGIFAADSAVIENCRIRNNSSPKGAGGINITGSVVVDNCTISGNNPSGITIIDGSIIIRNCRITRNGNKYHPGGGIGITSIYETTVAQVFNCIIDSNHGYGVSVGSANIFLTNSIVYRNIAGFSVKGDMQILNSISWGNLGESEGSKYFIPTSTYSDIQELRILYSVGNINSDPLFIDPDAGDFHLQLGSPCIDAGHPGVEYRDSDGSRNDMGIYGGPYGDNW